MQNSRCQFVQMATSDKGCFLPITIEIHDVQQMYKQVRVRRHVVIIV